MLWFRNEQDWYIGKPIMITENDHNVRLYNGDIDYAWQMAKYGLAIEKC